MYFTENYTNLQPAGTVPMQKWIDLRVDVDFEKGTALYIDDVFCGLIPIRTNTLSHVTRAAMMLGSTNNTTDTVYVDNLRFFEPTEETHQLKAFEAELDPVLSLGGQQQIQVSATSAAGIRLHDVEVQFETLTPDTIQVSDDGVVTPIAVGQAQIQVTVTRGDVELRQTLTAEVKDLTPASVTAQVQYETVPAGVEQKIDATAYTADGTPLSDAVLTYQSLTPAIAAVDQNGTVKSIAAGAAEIQVTAALGGKQAVNTLQLVVTAAETFDGQTGKTPVGFTPSVESGLMTHVLSGGGYDGSDCYELYDNASGSCVATVTRPEASAWKVQFKMKPILDRGTITFQFKDSEGHTVYNFAQYGAGTNLQCQSSAVENENGGAVLANNTWYELTMLLQLSGPSTLVIRNLDTNAEETYPLPAPGADTMNFATLTMTCGRGAGEVDKLHVDDLLIVPCGQEPMPSAVFTADGADTGILGGLEPGMQYKVDDGAWVDVVSGTQVRLTDLAACTISVMRKGNGNGTEDSDVQTISVTKAVQPELVATQPSVIGGTGTIPTQMTHEYSTDGVTYKACAGALTGLAPGDYFVRTKAVGTTLASQAQKITILAYVATQEDIPHAVFTATGADTGVLSGLESGMQYSVDDGEWKPVSSDAPLRLTGLSACTISILKTGNGTTTTDSEVQIISVTKADTPSAVFHATGYDTGVLTRVTGNMVYSVDGGENWLPITGESMKLDGVTEEMGVQIQALGAAATELDSAVQSIEVQLLTHVAIVGTAQNGTILANGQSINRTFSYGLPVTVTFIPDPGYRIHDVRINGRSLGPVDSYRIGALTDTVAFDLYCVKDGGTDPEPFPFVDVDETQWYYAYVKTAYQMGLVDGMTDERFGPDGEVTLAQAITLAARMHASIAGDELENGVYPFWYSTYVTYCLDKGILDEEPAADALNAPVTRSTYAAIFARALPAEMLPAVNDIPDNAIPDVAMDAVNADAIYLLYRAGVLDGRDNNGRFDPDATIKRSEIATILVRMMDASARVGAPSELNKLPLT